jgi:hypothetical protein
MRTTSLIGCAVLLLLSACSGGDPSTPASHDDAGPMPSAKDGGVQGDAKAPDASKAVDAAPACDVGGVGALAKVYTTDHQYEPRKLQAYNGVLYWATADEYDPSKGNSQVNAYVISQDRFFFIWSGFTPASLNVNAFGIYFTDFNLQHYDLSGGNGTSYSTISGYYPVLRTDGGYEVAFGSAVDHSDNKLYWTDVAGQWDSVHGLVGPFTEFMAADDTNLYFVTFSEPTAGPKEMDVGRANRKLDMSSVVGLGMAEDQEPSGFAIDASSVFVATKGTGASLAVSPKAGGSWTDLVLESGLENLVVGTTYVYFTDATGRLRRVMKDGSKPSEVVFTPCGRVTTVTMVGDTAYFIESTFVGTNGMLIWSVK